MNRLLQAFVIAAVLFGAGVLFGEPQPPPDAGPQPSIDLAIRLLYGNNRKPETADPELTQLVETLKKDFGYLNYDIRKSDKVTLKYDETATREMGDELIFIVRNLGVYKGQRKVWLELWFRGNKVFGAFSLFQKPAKPILIKGPNTNDGTYIIYLSLLNEEAK